MPSTDTRLRRILDLLSREYPDTPSLLDYRTPFELLIAVILSAQTTDNQVNTVLPDLFRSFPDAAQLAVASVDRVEEIIHPVGFFRRKARSIIGAAQHLQEYHHGSVPDTMDELVKIPGVGRKSAGVILLHVFDRPAIIVDTHFGRVVRRLGYSEQTAPEKLERDVVRVLEPELWGSASMRLNYHGRRYCFSRKPACDRCPVAHLCPSAEVNDADSVAVRPVTATPRTPSLRSPSRHAAADRNS